MHPDEIDEAILNLVDSTFGKVLEDIFDERVYQIGKKEYTSEHDDTHDQKELVDYARQYLTDYMRIAKPYWHRDLTTREMLIKAITLLVAEVERIDRLSTKQNEEN